MRSFTSLDFKSSLINPGFRKLSRKRATQPQTAPEGAIQSLDCVDWTGIAANLRVAANLLCTNYQNKAPAQGNSLAGAAGNGRSNNRIQQAIPVPLAEFRRIKPKHHTAQSTVTSPGLNRLGRQVRTSPDASDAFGYYTAASSSVT